MGSEQPDGQLEFFDVAGQTATLSRPASIGRIMLSLRYDHLVVAGIAAMIGSAVLFALGVERGKQLARVERAAPLIPQHTFVQSQPVGPVAVPQASAQIPGAGKRAGDAENAMSPATPEQRQRAKPEKERAPDRTRYAVQVVTYTRMQLARKEMDLLEARGERAFLVTNDGRTKVYVGPFGNRANASEKLVTLRGTYRDCFIRSL